MSARGARRAGLALISPCTTRCLSLQTWLLCPVTRCEGTVRDAGDGGGLPAVSCGSAVAALAPFSSLFLPAMTQLYRYAWWTVFYCKFHPWTSISSSQQRASARAARHSIPGCPPQCLPLSCWCPSCWAWAWCTASAGASSACPSPWSRY